MRLRVEAEQRPVRNTVQFYLTSGPGRQADSCGMLAVMSDEATYAPDLYRGTAEYYDRFRLSYPDALIADLVLAAAGRLRLRVGGKRPLRGGLGSAADGRAHASVGRHDDRS